MQRRELGITARLTRHSGVVHRHENAIRANEGEPEVELGETLVHHAAEHFWEPIVGGGEDAEDGSDAHDQVKVSGDESGVVKWDIEHGLREEGAADSAGHEERHKAYGEQHGRCETNAAAPESAEPVECLDGGGNADGHGHDGKGEGGIRAHSAHEHVMAPNHESEQADGENGVDHGLVAEDRLAREDGKQLRAQAHGGKNRDVDLGMSEEPEQMLPEQRRAAAVTDHLAVDDDQRHVKTRAGVAVKQQENSRREEDAEREQAEDG